MDESLKCECGNDEFWMFDNFSVARCTKCFTEYHYFEISKAIGKRNLDKEKHNYNDWEEYDG